MPAIPDVERALEDGTRLVYVHGDADILIDRVVDRAEAWGRERCGLPGVNAGRWRVSDDGTDPALTAARTLPMMGTLRVVVLRELEQARTDAAEALLAYFEDPSPSTLFIAVAGTFPKPRKGQKRWGARFANAVKRSGLHVKLDSKSVDRIAFASEHAAGLGVKLGRREAGLLVELVGQDLGRLARELDKVATFVGAGGRITPEALQAACSILAEESVWELTGGIARRDAATAVRALHRLLRDGQNGHYLLAMVAMQLRKVLQATQMLQRGAPAGQVGKVVRLRRQELAEVQRLARVAPLEPAHVLERLARANRAMNLSPAGPERVLEALVVDLCTA
jgi:DNA polymerase III subunit delta